MSTSGAYLGPPRDNQSLQQAHKDFGIEEFGVRYQANSLQSSGSCHLHAFCLWHSFRYKMAALHPLDSLGLECRKQILHLAFEKEKYLMF